MTKVNVPSLSKKEIEYIKLVSKPHYITKTHIKLIENAVKMLTLDEVRLDVIRRQFYASITLKNIHGDVIAHAVWDGNETTANSSDELISSLIADLIRWANYSKNHISNCNILRFDS